jgi:hypothetical protein
VARSEKSIFHFPSDIFHFSRQRKLQGPSKWKMENGKWQMENLVPGVWLSRAGE